MTQTFGDFPPTLATNNAVTCFLLLAILMIFVSTAHLKRFLIRQTQNFLYRPKSDKIFVQTGGETQYQLLLLTMTCISLSLAAALITGIAETDELLLLTVITIAIMGVKLVLHIVVGRTFFSPQDYRLWEPSLIYINAAEGALLLPAVLIQLYHGAPLKLFVAYVALVLVGIRVATLVKSWKTLHDGKQRPSLFLLYFWAAEVTPILVFMAIVAVGMGYEL